MSSIKKQRRSFRVSHACQRCKKRKIKCDTLKPCFNCAGSHSKCIYEYNSKKTNFSLLKFKDNVGVELCNIRNHVAELKQRQPSGYSTHLQRVLNEVSSSLEKLQPHLYFNLESEEVKSYRGRESLETQVLDSRCGVLNRFLNSKSYKAKNRPLVDTYHGLYSPSLFFTTIGLGWVIKRLLAYSDDKPTRETVYILLKHLESVVKQEGELKMTSGSPFEYYAKLNKISSSHDQIFAHIMSKISPELRQNISSWEKVNFSRGAEGFAFAVSIFKLLNKTFNFNKMDASSLKAFLEQYDMFVCLCFEQFERSVFSEMYNLAYLQDLIYLVRNAYWSQDPFTVGKLISPVCRRSLDLGLNRWEYYIGHDERTAENYRRLWWDSYWWDGWYALVTGKPPLISDEYNSCLFPRQVVELGVDDSMNCLTLINSVTFESNDFDGFVLFGYILLGKIIKEVFSELLYNKSFTDYRVHAHPTLVNFKEILKELMSKLDNVFMIFYNLERKLYPFLSLHLDLYKAYELYVHAKYVEMCCFQGIESLLIRIQSLIPGSQSNEISEKIKQSKNKSFRASADLLLHIFKKNDGLVFFKLIWITTATTLNITTSFIQNSFLNSVYYLSLLCAITKAYNDLVKNIFLCVNSISLVHQKKFESGVVALSILTRICLQTYMSSHNIREERLLEELKKSGINSAETAKVLLDMNSSCFKILLARLNKTGYVKGILEEVDKDLTDLVDHDAKTFQATTGSTVVPGDATSPENELYNIMDCGTPESFNPHVLLEFLDLIWDDIDA